MPMPDVNTLFAGRTVFLTGGSGFVGQVVIEKLLYAVPDFEKIYVLVRPAKGKSPAERWTAISEGVLFNRVRAECPQNLEKVVPVEGDITIDDMGLSEENLKRVLEETSVVIHCAATVRFDDTLRSAIELNLKGVQRMIKLAKRMPKLDALVHCSTAYVNVYMEGEIEEKQYPAPCDPYKLIDAQSWMTDDMLDGITKAMAKKGYYNTYCFTKHVAEELVRLECTEIPTLIFRPAIIAGIWKDGIPGWADSLQGMTAGAMGYGTGTFPRMPCNVKNPTDIVPVDVVSNMLICCAAYRLHLTTLKDKSMPVFHCGTSHLRPLQLETFRDLCGTFFDEYPLERFIFAPTVGSRGHPDLEEKLHVFKHRVVGPAFDRIGSLAGKKPFWERTFRKIREVYGVFAPFISKNWIYKSDNALMLIDNMDPDDVEKFDFDVRKLDWTDFTSDMLFGLKTFLMKNDIMSDENIAVAKRKVKMFKGAELIANLMLGWVISVLITHSFDSWAIAFCIGFATFYYLTCDAWVRVEIGSIDNYRKRMNAAIGIGPLNNNHKKLTQ
ncbi:hypothetical protein PRIPAC_81586 [Pristionchus pacificus]|uniref:Fatty acyl-CoA reductase n=1 Tax=Pristionchus pacificus TaxID=54126 RepID=A0A454XNH6_PRIPA|nr:hypothetical protein PRIPAC_81586 [Pristionchus pacificus]|eukprot:PDM78632.1 epimerase [Pristionchus pacificus]